MNYTHLTQDERYPIAILAKAGHDQSDIARLMERQKSTIGREMTRNRGERGYRPKQAHKFSQARMQACENGLYWSSNFGDHDGCFTADCFSKAMGAKLPSAECGRVQL